MAVPPPAVQKLGRAVVDLTSDRLRGLNAVIADSFVRTLGGGVFEPSVHIGEGLFRRSPGAAHGTPFRLKHGAA